MVPRVKGTHIIKTIMMTYFDTFGSKKYSILFYIPLVIEEMNHQLFNFNPLIN